MAKLGLRKPIKSLSGRLSRDITIKHFRDSGMTLMTARRGPDRVRRQQPREAAAQQAFREAMGKAGPELLEPFGRLEIVTPPEYIGDVINDLGSRRAEIVGMENRSGAQIVKAVAPIGETFGYATALRAATQGRATFALEFLRYDRVPRQLAEQIVRRTRGYMPDFG